MDTQTIRSIAKVTALTATAALAGQISLFSTVAIPSLVGVPDEQAVAIWERLYRFGAGLMPSQAIVCCLTWSFLASTATRTSRSFALYSLAAILTPSIAPYTWTVQRSINGALFLRASKLAGPSGQAKGGAKPKTYGEGAKKLESEKSLPQLFASWARYNAARAVIVGVAAVCGAVGMVGEGL